MNLLKNIKIKWLRHRVYKYTLKYEDCLSKSNTLLQTVNRYETAYVRYYWLCGAVFANSTKFIEKIKDAKNESNYFANLARIYLSKKTDLEKELSSL